MTEGHLRIKRSVKVGPCNCGYTFSAHPDAQTAECPACDHAPPLFVPDGEWTSKPAPVDDQEDKNGGSQSYQPPRYDSVAAPAALAVQETNFVTPSTARSVLSDVDPRVVSRVAEFASAYPDLARQPLTETHGRKLRECLTDPEFVDRWVDPETETESAFKIVEEKRRPPVTWIQAVARFLEAHSDYEGLYGRFEPVADGDDSEFRVDFEDAWGSSYMDTEYARAKALDRQVSGGDLPTGSEISAQWSDPATCMLTLTASARQLLAVDHLDAVHDSFTKDGVRDTLRNTMEHHLGLDASQWGYWLQAEPHGAGDHADPDETPGVNACYTHIHVAVYFDAAPLFGDLDGDPYEPGSSTHARWESIGSEFERVIDKHLDECDPAGWSAHNYESIDSYVLDDDGCISLNPDVENLGSYLAAYLGGYKGDLFERSIEYIAWGSIYWATARQRTTRSLRVNHAIKADACQQRAESHHADQSVDHGDRVEWNSHHGPDVVCSCCGSGWNVDQSQLEEPQPIEIPGDSQPEPVRADGGTESVQGSETTEPDVPTDLADRWPSADGAFRIGELPAKARVRSIVDDYLDDYPGDPSDLSVPRLIGELSGTDDAIPPHLSDFVADLLDGSADSDRAESFTRNSGTPVDEWELVAIVDADGEEHTPGDGGVSMAAVDLPEKNIVENTRLSNDRAKGEHWYDRRTGVAHAGGVPPESIARYYVDEGITDPAVVDRILGLTDHYDLDRDCMEHPDGKPRYGKG